MFLNQVVWSKPLCKGFQFFHYCAILQNDSEYLNIRVVHFCWRSKCIIDLDVQRLEDMQVESRAGWKMRFLAKSWIWFWCFAGVFRHKELVKRVFSVSSKCARGCGMPWHQLRMSFQPAWRPWWYSESAILSRDFSAAVPGTTCMPRTSTVEQYNVTLMGKVENLWLLLI